NLERGMRGHADGEEGRGQTLGAAGYPETLRREGAADLREDARRRGRAVRRGRARAPHGDGLAQAYAREAWRPVGAEGPARPERSALPEDDGAEAARRRRHLRRRRRRAEHEARAVRAGPPPRSGGPLEGVEAR